MSSMIARAAALKPEIRLAQSVSEFEASLSDEHKATFRSYRSQALSKPPDPSDVMRFTAEIDRRAVQKDGGGQCFGPRLTNILQAVQQYAALGDVIIGGSQNIIACGIWSLLRLTLLALVSFSSYIEKLSRLLMVAGRKAPRYEQMALLYARSTDLQSSLSEYFIVVVQLCRQLYKTTQKTTLGSYFSFLSDHDLKEHESNLLSWADSIKDEVTLMTARKITDQSTFLGALSKSSENESRRKRLRTRLRMLEACSTYDHQTTWKEIRKLGNSTILTLLDRYSEWKAQTTSSTLLCTGKLGFGKSVLLANMIDELNLSANPTESAVVYFFCRHDIQESLRARTIIGCIARQLLNANLSHLSDQIPDINITSGLDDLLDFVLETFPKTRGAFIVLDGLDECDDHEREATLESLKRLQKAFFLKVCCSFRSDMHLEAEKEAAAILLRSVVTQLPEDNPDISSFITKELQRRIDSGRLCIGDPSLISEIERALAHRAQGMFLWVKLQIASLCTAQSDEEIREALEDLPKGLPETFSRILKKCRSTGGNYQQLIFKLCVAARRPLTMEELREALSVSLYNIEWKPARLINNIFAVLAYCGSLITVDEEDLTVRLVHHSVKQYLLGDFDPSSDPILTLKDADKAMGDAIITYLNYNEFENAVSRTFCSEILAEDIPSAVAQSVLRYSGPARQVALKVFKHRKSYQHDMRDILLALREHTSQNDKFYFHDYAKAFWLCHVRWSLSSLEGQKARTLLIRLLKKDRVDVNAKDDHGETLIWKAVASGSMEIVQYLIDSGISIEVLGRDRVTLLHLSATMGHANMIEPLLDYGAEIEAQDYDGRTALSLAALKGHATVIETLLNKGAYIETRDETDWTPLLLAVKAGHESASKLLLDRNANVEAWNSRGWAALSFAALEGHTTIIDILLDKGADIEARRVNVMPPLLLAVKAGHKSAARLLLNRNACIEVRNGNGSTAVFLAAKGGHHWILKRLLKKGANPNPRNWLGNTPLFIAVENGHLITQKLLLDRGVDLEEKNNSAMTPLILAACDGHIPSIQFLLDRGANIEAEDHNGRRALHWAAYNGHLDAFRNLASRNADIDAEDKNGFTALELAISRGHKAAVLHSMHAFLDEGVNIFGKISEDRTPLHLSAEQGKLKLVQLLLENGARLQERTADGRTALDLAAQQGHVRVVEHLLDQAAELKLKTYGYETAISVAVKNGHDEVVQCLLAHGGARNTAI